MPEVSSLFNGVQLGAETTASPGTAVSASKLMNYLNWQPTFWAGDFNVMTPMGQKAGSGVAPGYDYTSWELSSDVGSYSEIIYPLASLLKDAADGDGIARRVIPVDPRDLGLGAGGEAPVQRPYAAVVGCSDARVPI